MTIVEFTKTGRHRNWRYHANYKYFWFAKIVCFFTNRADNLTTAKIVNGGG